MRRSTYRLCGGLAVLGVVAAGMALAAPVGLSQKPGLWQMQQQVGQMPRPVVTKMCVDATMSDRLVDASQNMKGVTCTKRDIHMRPGGASVDSVCSLAGRTVTTHADINMPTPNAFHETVQSSFTPAVAGHATSASTIDATWQGACPAGMRPGDMIMNGMKINMYDMAASMKHRP